MNVITIPRLFPLTTHQQQPLDIRPQLAETIFIDHSLFIARSIDTEDPIKAQQRYQQLFSEQKITEPKLVYLAPARETDPYWWEARQVDSLTKDAKPYWRFD